MSRIRMLRTLVLLALLDLGGCSGPRALEREVTGQPLVTACLESYRLIDDAVANAGVRDVEAHRVPGFPYLRVNRFLASFSEQDLSPARLEAWVDRLVRLDREGRTVELKNLPDGSRARLDDAIAAVLGAGWRAPDVVERCPPILRQHDLGRTDRQEALLARVEVPEDYSLIERALGLYPLTAIPVAMAWQRWEAKHLLPFRTPTAELDFEGAPVLYLPEIESAAASAEEVTAILERSRDTALGISEPEGEDLKSLAASFAPAYLVDTVSPADRIGHPVWLEERIPGVDTTHPVAFVRTEQAWFDGGPVLQLVYTIWFPARPPDSPLDILGGRLDGLIWRVSLAPDGTPLIYDSIHPCGCYHLFFPAPGVARKRLPQDRPEDIRETATVPQPAPPVGSGARLVLRLAAGSHYLSGLTLLPEGARGRREMSYGLVIDEGPPELALRSMPLPGGGRRSLYAQDAIVPGTERAERYILWPMGIASAGAMRQWGNHATAFVGRRHFDDPFLLDRAFGR
jgi:hypothetical protein